MLLIVPLNRYVSHERARLAIAALQRHTILCAFSGTSTPGAYNWKTEPPPPYLAGIEQDDEGLLWAFIHVAAPTWKEAWPKVPEGVREIPSSRIQHELLYMTRVK